MIKVMNRAPDNVGRKRMSSAQGNKEERTSRMLTTVSELCTQLTQRFAISPAGTVGLAGRQGRTTHVSGGFTIIELMIASSVFSLILLVALAGFTSIGRIFYKGVTINQTQNITSQVITNISNNIQNAASVSTLQKGKSYNYYYYCIGGVRYTFNLTPKEIDTSQPQDLSPGGNFGLIKDQLPGPTACAEPCPTTTGCAGGTLPFNKPAELLGNHMRLMKLDIASANGELYNINITIAFGADSAFSDVNDPDKIACTGGQQDQAFCSVTRLSTGVYQGLHS